MTRNCSSAERVQISEGEDEEERFIHATEEDVSFTLLQKERIVFLFFTVLYVCYERGKKGDG